MVQDFVTSLKLCGVTFAICGVAYPVAVLMMAIVIAPEARLGTLVTDEEGHIRGSRLLAQSIDRPEYFWPRPSACDYDASAAAGSNLSPANPAIRKRAADAVLQIAAADDIVLPADLVTTSGSGLDPHISVAAAKVQSSRVAMARGIAVNEVLTLIAQRSQQIPLTNDVAARIVNVLELNLALDQQFQ